MREITYLHAYGGEAYEMVEPFLETDSLDHDDYEAFEQQFLDLQKRRFRQNATVQSPMIYYSVDLYKGLPRREALWWAISSVITGEHYPHRVFMAK